VRAGRCAPGARAAGVTRPHPPHGKNHKQPTGGSILNVLNAPFRARPAS